MTADDPPRNDGGRVASGVRQTTEHCAGERVARTFSDSKPILHAAAQFEQSLDESRNPLLFLQRGERYLE